MSSPVNTLTTCPRSKTRGDSPEWQGKRLDAVIERTPIGRLVKMSEVAQATRFLLDSPAMNGVDLFVDGGWMLR
jgi:NAD(P)-dependent dehydrogenase (short-subunit alcohol dehydrogenase family)